MYDVRCTNVYIKHIISIPHGMNSFHVRDMHSVHTHTMRTSKM